MQCPGVRLAARPKCDPGRMSVIRPGDEVDPGDVLGFRFGDVLPPTHPVAEWLIVVAASFNDLSFVYDHLERSYDEPHEYLYWLRLGVAHFTEAALHLAKSKEDPAVKTYVESFPADVQERYERCLAIFEERRKELFLIRNALFHYRLIVNGERVIHEALKALENDRTTFRIGKIKESRLFFADDVAAAIFTRSVGVPWKDVTEDEMQKHVEEAQLRIHEAVAAYMRFANPILAEPFGQAMAEGVRFWKVELTDPTDWRKGWKAIRDDSAGEASD